MGEDDKGVDNVIMGRKCPAPFLFEDKQKNRAKCGDGIVVLSTTRQGSLWIKVVIVYLIAEFLMKICALLGYW